MMQKCDFIYAVHILLMKGWKLHEIRKLTLNQLNFIIASFEEELRLMGGE